MVIEIPMQADAGRCRPMQGSLHGGMLRQAGWCRRERSDVADRDRCRADYFGWLAMISSSDRSVRRVTVRQMNQKMPSIISIDGIAMTG